VIDAFHVVNRAPIPERFFVDERKTRDGIVITDELLKLKETVQFENLPLEAEARFASSRDAVGTRPASRSLVYETRRQRCTGSASVTKSASAG
jgi:hypothetical protein